MQVFPVTSYPCISFCTLLGLTVGLPLTLVGLTLYFSNLLPGWLWVFAVSVSLGFMLSITIAMLALLLYTLTRNEITLRDDTVHIKGGAYHERIPLDTITETRVVDLRVDTQFRPARRQNGIRLPGYQAGWYTLENGSWAFVLKTAKRQAVYIRSSNEFVALLGVRDPAAMVRRIQD